MFDQDSNPKSQFPEATPQLPAMRARQESTLDSSRVVKASRYENPTDLNLRETLKIVRKRLWLIVGIVLVVTTMVTLQTFRTRPLYQAAATIEVGPNNDNAARVGNEVVIQQEDQLYVTMNTSEVIIKSAPLLEDVVARLGLDHNPAFIEVTKDKSVGESISDLAAKLQQSDTQQTPAIFNSTQPKSNIGGRSQEEVDRLAPYVAILESSVNVRPIRDTRAMTVSYTHSNPELATRIANAIATRYVQTSFDKKVESFTSASEWLDRSTRELKSKVERAEQALADYTRTNNIYALNGQGTLITEKLSHLHDQATRKETDRILQESLHDQIIQGGLDQIPENFADPKIGELQRKLGELEVSAAELRVTYGPKYSKVLEISRQMDEIRDQIAKSRKVLDGKLKADYERAVQDERALNAALAAAKVEATNENQNAIQYSLLKQDVDTSKALYTEFLQKTNQAGLQVAQQHSNIRVIAPARVPRAPISPNRQRTILLGFLMSLAGGFGLAWLLERLDNTIRTTEDVQRYTRLPTLAVIPSIRTGNVRLVGVNSKTLSITSKQRPAPHIQRARLMEFDSRSPVAESYRALRTGLLLSAAGNPPKTILVTSVQMGDGKTTTATNIAIALAQLGSSVVVIDADLRKPSVHGVFGIPQSPGLSTYLTGNGSIEEVTCSVVADRDLSVENLRLIPAGPTPPNPSELLSSEGMKRLLGHLCERFDHVVIDSPPLGSATDSVVLATMVDGVVLVVHSGKNPRQAVERGCQELSSVGSRIFGVVLNGVDLRREGYDEYYYYTYSYPNDHGKVRT